MRNPLLALMRRPSARTALPAVLIVLLVSCQVGSGRVVALDVGTTSNEVNLLILIAEDQGYFAANGLDVTHRIYPSGVAGLGGLLDHEVELVTGSEFALVGQVLAGEEVCALASINRSAIEYLVARMDRGISNLADLKGKAVGVPLDSRPEFALDRFLYYHGIDVAEMRLVDVPVSESADALVSGQVDAIAAWEPYTDQARERLEGSVVSWSVQENQPSYSLLMSRLDWATENRDATARFLRSLLQAETFVEGDPEAAQAIVRERLSYDESYAANIWEKHSFSILLDRALIVTLEDQARWIMARDPARATEMPDFLRYICSESLEAVRPEAVQLIR